MAVFETPRSRVSRLVVTGAAGGIGTALRGRLDHLADDIVLSDLDDVATSGKESSRPCDLTDLNSVRALLRGGGDVLHFGGQSREAPFETILQANLVGTYNLYEAARLEGVRRVLFASSNHTIGFHLRERRLRADAPVRPDSLYGVSKVYGEAVARLYYDKFGVESLLLRIGSCFPAPRDRRMLATWLSYDDLLRAIEAMIRVPKLGCPIVYGASDNAESWWDNGDAAHLGWRPQDSAEPHRTRLEAETPEPDPLSPAVLFQGGGFCAAGHPDDA
jgi:uronate dehydrogenase